MLRGMLSSFLEGSGVGWRRGFHCGDADGGDGEGKEVGETVLDIVSAEAFRKRLESERARSAFNIGAYSSA